MSNRGPAPRSSSQTVWRNVAANVLLKGAWEDQSFPFEAASEDEALRAVAEAYWSGENPMVYGLDSRPEALILGEVKVFQEASCE